MVTSLEHIPNEVLLEIFSYIASADVVFAFANLNARLQRLLDDCCRAFDLAEASKEQFDTIFALQNTNRWVSLKLSAGAHTPGQVKHFADNHSFVGRFVELRSLSIVNTTVDELHPLFRQLPSLVNLVSLELSTICGHRCSPIALPNLTQLVVRSCASTSWFEAIEDFPRLATIEYTIADPCKLARALTWPRSVQHLKITYNEHRDVPLIEQSLMNLPQLTRLEIYQKLLGKLPPSGERWEQLLSTSVPSLRQFQFSFQFTYNDRTLPELRPLIASFSTPFFGRVRCDVSSRHEKEFYDVKYGVLNSNQRRVILYTLPPSCDEFTVFETHSKGKLGDQQTSTRAKVKTLVVEHDTLPDAMFERSFIVNLIINNAFEALPWAHLLQNLKHLTLNSCTTFSTEAFNTLLENTPQLHSLTATKSVLKRLTDNWSDICACRRLSRRIRSLTFTVDRSTEHFFHRNELERILPMFASQCRHLSLAVHSHSDTVDFILQKMRRLVSLHVRVPTRQSSTIKPRMNCIFTQIKQDCYFWLE